MIQTVKKINDFCDSGDSEEEETGEILPRLMCDAIEMRGTWGLCQRLLSLVDAG